MNVTDIGEATDEAVVCSAATVPEPTTPTDDAPPVRVRQPRLAPVRLRNVYVAALPIGFTDIHLAELLGQFGKLTSCRMFNDSRRVESVGRAYGFGLFERADDAQKAVSGLSGLLVDGHRIQVRLSDTHVVKKTKATRKAALGLVAGCDQGLQDDDNAPACHAPMTKVVEAFVDDIFITRRPADVVTASERRNWNPSPRQQSQASSHPSGNRYPSPLPASASSSSSSPQGFNTSPYMASSAPHVVLQAQHPGQGSTMDLFAASTMPPTTFAGMTALPPPGAPPHHHPMMLPPPPNAASHFVALPTTPHLNVMPPLASGYTTSSSTQAPLQQQHHHYAHMHHHHQHLPPPHQQQAVVPFHPPPLPFHQQLQPSQHHHHHHYHHHQQHHHHYFYAAHPSPPPPPY